MRDKADFGADRKRTRKSDTQGLVLLPVIIEIFGRQPILIDRLHALPVPVRHREPGRVAIGVLHDHVLPEHAFRAEAKPLGRAF